MHRDARSAGAAGDGEVIDFDQAFLEARQPGERAELMTEAGMLAAALPQARRTEHLEALAEALCDRGRDPQMSRAWARKLAAALRCLARNPRG